MVDLSHRVMGSAPGAEPVRTREEIASKIGSSTSFKDAWATRSRLVAIPR